MERWLEAFMDAHEDDYNGMSDEARAKAREIERGCEDEWNDYQQEQRSGWWDER